MEHLEAILRRLLTRRSALALIGAGGALVLGALARRPAAQGMPACVVRPEQTEGPFFVEERLERVDIRSDPGTDVNGLATFMTIYPGWYEGRAVHIHFKVRRPEQSKRGREFTSQIYFDDAVSDKVFARAPYATRGGRHVRNEDDGLFRRGGSRLIIALKEDAAGYAGTFDVGLAS